MRKQHFLMDKIIGRNLNRIRSMNGFTQKSLGEACDPTHCAQQISKYENGSNRISTAQLVEFSTVLNCSALDLMEGVVDLMPPGQAVGREELELIKSYNNLPKAMQRVIRGLVHAIVKEVAGKVKAV